MSRRGYSDVRCACIAVARFCRRRRTGVNPSASSADVKQRTPSVHDLWEAVFRHALSRSRISLRPFIRRHAGPGSLLFFAYGGLCVILSRPRATVCHAYFLSCARRESFQTTVLHLAHVAVLCNAPRLFTANEARARHMALPPAACAARHRRGGGILDPARYAPLTLNYRAFFLLEFTVAMNVASPSQHLGCFWRNCHLLFKSARRRARGRDAHCLRSFR
jgi:hypothetical protein